jgi:predicted secreted protein
MTKIMIPRITCLLLILLLLSTSTLMAADATVTVGKEQGGREIALKVGNTLQIELPGRGGTGYSWAVEAPGAPYLKLISQETRQVKKDLPGGPVIQIWRFKAEKPGATETKMSYYRPWEGVGKAVDHFLIKIRIE